MIRKATKHEALPVLNEPQNAKRIGMVSTDLKYQPWVAIQNEYKLIFFFWPVEGDSCEVHIVAPKNSILKARILAKEIIEWLFKSGVKRIITNCPKGSIENFAKKIGMNIYRTENGAVYMEVRTWL
ncbi:MAG: hypothetical protein RPR40_13670 [Bermanella sp.]